MADLNNKQNKKTTCSDFKLKDFKNIRTPFCFFDETGNLNDKTDRFFALGMLKCLQPYYLDYSIRRLRQKYKFFDEMKFNKLSKNNIRICLLVLDLVFKTRGIKFSCIILNKDDIDFAKTFRNDVWLAYERFAQWLLIGNIAPNEILNVIADYTTTPPGKEFEVNVKHKLNHHFDRLAISGVCRVDSKGVNLLQVCDLLLGAVAYDYKRANKLVSGDYHKIKFLDTFKKNLGIKTFVGGFRNYNFNIHEHQEHKEKGPSS